MGTGLGDFAPHIVAMLAGGLGTSLGLTWLSRRPKARRTLLATPGWALVLGALLVVAGGAGAIFWLVRSFMGAVTGEPAAPGPAALLVFGVGVGLPLALPGIVMAWFDARAARAAELKKRDFVPTKDDRRKFASDLVRQITELSHERREVSASIGGDGGRVLQIEGDLAAEEGRRLVGALKADLKELGFKRVEGSGAKGEWWERV